MKVTNVAGLDIAIVLGLLFTVAIICFLSAVSNFFNLDKKWCVIMVVSALTLTVMGAGLDTVFDRNKTQQYSVVYPIIEGSATTAGKVGGACYVAYIEDGKCETLRVDGRETVLTDNEPKIEKLYYKWFIFKKTAYRVHLKA